MRLSMFSTQLCREKKKFSLMFGMKIKMPETVYGPGFLKSNVKLNFGKYPESASGCFWVGVTVNIVLTNMTAAH